MEREQLVGAGFGDEPRCLCAGGVGQHLYAGGNFTTAGGSAANYIAQWDGSSWSALGSGMNGDVSCAGGVGQQPVCGRRFHDGGRQPGQLHRQMEREQLVGLGSELGGGLHWLGDLHVDALAVSGSDLYAGGYFTTAGGNAANDIAKWNGSSWSALGSGLQEAYPYTAYVRALAVSGSDSMWAALSRRRAAVRPITSPNGTGAVGRRWVRG